MRGGAKVHYVRGSGNSNQTRRHVFFDTEATTHYANGIQTQRWQLGCARYLDTDSRRSEPVMFDEDYVDPQELWRVVGEFTRPKTRTIVWAHNLAYDLRISRALEILPRMGWTLTAINLDGVSAWAKWTFDSRTLVMADFTSWVSVPLSRIGGWLNIEQEPLPLKPDDIPGMFKRCRQDVVILQSAVSQTLKWLEDNDLGPLQITGAGQSWAAFRRRFMTHKILVHDDQVARAAERRSIWTGRTETWRHGKYDTFPTWEFDLARAYATIARDTELPTVHVGSLPHMSVDNFRKWSASRRILSEVTVTTSQPLVPTSHDDRILFPVGTFRTTLWDCEIHLLLAHGAAVHLGISFVYTREPCLSAWASWVLSAIDPENPTVGPLQARILKQWSRALVGRFALQYRSWEDAGTSDVPELLLTRVVGPGEVKGAQLFHVGHAIKELGGMAETENALPQLTGYITSMCRVRLWELMEVAGLENVFYTDTDSLIVNAEGRENLLARIALDGAYGLTEKQRIRHLELQGPRALTVDGVRRHSGVPRRARPTGSDEVVGEVWEGLGEALRHGRPDVVKVTERHFKIAGGDRRREWLPDGRTRALVLDESEVTPPLPPG